jgi:hypothetical protein
MYTPTPIFTSTLSSSSTTASSASTITTTTTTTTNHNHNHNLNHNNKDSNWPLEEYEETQIMNALQQCISPTSSIYSEDEDLSSSTTSYFLNCRAIFQLNKLRRESLSNSVRCSICRRRFHSQGNLSNHTQLYH